MKKLLIAVGAALACSGAAAQGDNCQRIDLKGTDGKPYYFNYCVDEEFSVATEFKSHRISEKALKNKIAAAVKKGTVEPDAAIMAVQLRTLASQIIGRSEVCSTPAWAQSAVKAAYEVALSEVGDEKIKTAIDKSYKASRKLEAAVVDKASEDDEAFCQNINLRDPSGKIVNAR